MEGLLTYLFKSAAFISIFYLCYLLLLRRETSFRLNRNFLLSGIIGSAILPAIYFTRKVYIQATSYSGSVLSSPTEIIELKPDTSIDWWQIAGWGYLLVTGFFLLKLILQLSSVFRIILQNETENESGFKYLKTSEYQLPFSFFRYIVYNPSYHSEKDLKLILEHERVHARQFHSADIIIANLASCLLWFNPLTWLYKKALEQNLEFIADRESINSNTEIKDYQYALLKASVSNLKPAITNHFYKSFIKKRITMLNKKSSKSNPAWKISLIAPLILALMLSFNLRTVAQIIEEDSETTSVERNQDTNQTLEESIQKEEFTDTNPTKSTQDPVDLNELGENPLYVINGKEYKSRKLKNKFVAIKSGFEILLGEKATDRFGKQAKDGVVIVPNGEIMDDFSKDVKKFKDQKNLIFQYFLINESGKPNYVKLYSDDKPANTGKHRKKIIITEEDINPNEEGENVIMIKKNKENGQTTYEYKLKDTVHPTVYKKGDANQTQIKKEISFTQKDGEPIYIIDGETVEDIEEIDLAPDNIKTINVFKDEMAIEKYGKKAENGVVRIYTKQFSEKNNEEQIFVIKPDFTNSQLEALKEKIRKETEFELSLNNVKRNKEGLISKIEIKFKSGSQMAAGTYVGEDGIKEVHFGIQKNGGVIISSSK